MWFALQVIFILLVSSKTGATQKENCADLVFDNLSDDTISVVENYYINVTFWVNMSACTHLDTGYKVAVKTNTSGGIMEEDGRVELTKDTCTVTTAKHVTCARRNGVAELYRSVNRSHVQQEWKMWWKDGNGYNQVQKKLLLNVSYKPSVTSLTVNGQEVNGVHLISENQTVLLNCSFDKGRPPTVFRLTSESRQEVTPTFADGYMTQQVRIGRCEDSWPTFSCEGNGSKRNGSVEFLLRCPPMFADVRPNVTNLATYQQFTFRMRSHTRAMERCIMVSGAKEASTKGVNCYLTGNPPDLLLKVQLYKEDNSLAENWTLITKNEVGGANTTLYLQDTAKCFKVSSPTLWRRMNATACVDLSNNFCCEAFQVQLDDVCDRKVSTEGADI